MAIQHVPFAKMQNAATRLLQEGDELDEIWCVLDDDERPGARDITDWISRRDRTDARRPRMVGVVSKPCFEFWLLLHFGFTDKHFVGMPGLSACAQVIRELKRHLPDYEKNDRGLYERLAERMPDAMERAKRLSDAGAASFTDIWKLIERLEQLRGP